MSDAAVLVFGADRSARLALQRDIAAHGFTVLLASSQAEAAKCVATGRVRVVVMADELNTDTHAPHSPARALPFPQADNIAVIVPNRERAGSSESASDASDAVVAAVRAALRD